MKLYLFLVYNKIKAYEMYFNLIYISRYQILIIKKISISFYKCIFSSSSSTLKGWSGGAMVLDKLPGPGRPTSLDKSRARAYCTCSRCGWGFFGHFYSHLSFLLFLPPFGRRPDID